MSKLTVQQKLEILSDAAKYDASCASSGTAKRHSGKSGGLGSTEGHGICHAYAPDGRCISLLKILMTNFCIYDCVFCVNRASSNVARARFSVEEIVSLTIEFYRRNYIEGLFLSSGIIKSSDHTMEAMVRVARTLRIDHSFRGYIHLKAIPHASPELVREAGLYADRLSMNIELPTDESFKHLVPEKDVLEIKRSMANIKSHIADASEKTLVKKRQKPFAPAGQSTQLIVGADASNDATVLSRSSALYSSYGLKRVYYSAFSPIPDSSKFLPLIKPPLMREHRLYQADWLMRFYGFSLDEVTSTAQEGMLDLAVDPKLAFALRNRHLFPLDVNRADREMLLRVPGFGTKSVKKILAARRHGTLRYDDLVRLGAGMKNAKPFVLAADWSPGQLVDDAHLRSRFVVPQQLSLL
jgi:putative DNA modification/repair radical SAM protein